MTRVGLVIVVLILVRTGAVAEEKLKYATEKVLMMTNRVTVAKESSPDAPDMASAHLEFFNTGYVLEFESTPIHFAGKQVRIRVWDKGMKSWPGSNPQIIQVLDEKSVVLSAKKVGGQPMMIDVWTAHHYGRSLYVYVKCRHRHRMAPGVYIYEVDEKYSIEEKGTFFAKDDIEEEEEHRRDMLEEFREDYEQTPRHEFQPTFYKEALEAFWNGDKELAHRKCLEALELNPNHSECKVY